LFLSLNVSVVNPISMHHILVADLHYLSIREIMITHA